MFLLRVWYMCVYTVYVNATGRQKFPYRINKVSIYLSIFLGQHVTQTIQRGKAKAECKKQARVKTEKHIGKMLENRTHGTLTIWHWGNGHKGFNTEQIRWWDTGVCDWGQGHHKAGKLGD